MVMRQQFDYRPHPAVDWSTVKMSESGRKTVEVTCPWCKQTRHDDAAHVSYRIRKGTYTGYCYKDRLVNRLRADSPERPEHPLVDWNDTVLKRASGHQRLTYVKVTCPTCGETRYMLPNRIAYKIRQGTFTGECLPCTGRAKKRVWITLGPGRRIEPAKGYVRITRNVVPPEDQWLWDGLKRTGSMVLEHRFVMSKMLGRPLLTNELVDHMDGNKLNNDPSNLRLYIRGKNQPGETSGYGTYYHEWQLALARIRELEAQLKECANVIPAI